MKFPLSLLTITFLIMTVQPLLGRDKEHYQEHILSAPVPDKEGRYDLYYIPVVKGTAESLQGYGRIVEDKDSAIVDIVTWPALGWRKVVPGTGNEAGTSKGLFEMHWEGDYCYATNHAIKAKYLTAWSCYPTEAKHDSTAPRRLIITHEANYHPDGGQFVYPLNKKPFILILALPGDDISPKDFVAFYFDGTAGFHINPGVWHQPAFPLEESLELYNEQGAVHACIDSHFAVEFDCLLAIDLDSLSELKKK